MNSDGAGNTGGAIPVGDEDLFPSGGGGIFCINCGLTLFMIRSNSSSAALFASPLLFNALKLSLRKSNVSFCIEMHLLSDKSC